MSRDVLFDEDRALRRSMDLPAKQHLAQVSRVKLEEPDVQVQTQGTSSTNQRESGGQDPLVIDLKDEMQQ